MKGNTYMDNIGRYKGRQVYKVRKNDLKRDMSDDTIYAIEETGELIFQCKVIGSVDWKNMHVEEFQRSYPYKQYRYPEEKREAPVYAESPRPSKKKAPAAKEEKGIPVEDLGAFIDSFLADARNREVTDYVTILEIEEFSVAVG